MDSSSDSRANLNLVKAVLALWISSKAGGPAKDLRLLPVTSLNAFSFNIIFTAICGECPTETCSGAQGFLIKFRKHYPTWSLIQFVDFDLLRRQLPALKRWQMFLVVQLCHAGEIFAAWLPAAL